MRQLPRLRRRYGATSTGRHDPKTPTMSFTPSAWLPQPYVLRHHLHLITAVKAYMNGMFGIPYLYFAVPGGVKYPTSSVRLGFFGNLFLFPKGNLLQFKFREAGVSHDADPPTISGLALHAQASMYPDGHEISQGPSCTLRNHTCLFSDKYMHCHMSHASFGLFVGDPTTA